MSPYGSAGRQDLVAVGDSRSSWHFIDLTSRGAHLEVVDGLAAGISIDGTQAYLDPDGSVGTLPARLCVNLSTELPEVHLVSQLPAY